MNENTLSLNQVEEFWSKVCFDPDFKPEGRFQTYRELVTDSMLDVIQNICPVARGILSTGEWQDIFWGFLQNSPPRSQILRKLPYELAQYLKTADFPLKDRYPYLGELLEYEYLEIEVRFAPEQAQDDSVGKGIVTINTASALGHYHWPVHFISEENCQASQLPQGDYFLLVWRDLALEENFLEVNLLVYQLLKKISKGPVLVEKLLQEIALENEFEVSSLYLQEARELLKNLLKQEIIFGNFCE